MAESIDYRMVARELIVAARGTQPQREVSRRLGYEYNILTKWESGSQQISWRSFVKLTECCGLDLSAVMDSVLIYSQDLLNVSTLFAHLSPRSSLSAFAQIVGRSRGLIAKWFQGSGEPRLEDILRLLHHNHQLESLIHKLVGVQNIPSLRAANSQNQYGIHSQLLNHIVLEFLKTQTYTESRSGDARMIANHLRAPTEEIEATLEFLLSIKVIESGPDGRYLSVQDSITNSAGSSREESLANVQLKLQSHDYVRDYLERLYREIANDRERSDSAGPVAFAVCAVSRDTFEQVSAHLAQAMHEMVRLLAEDKGSKEIVLGLNASVIPMTKSR